MKITKNKLKQLIKEELQAALYEGNATGLKELKKLIYDVAEFTAFLPLAEARAIEDVLEDMDFPTNVEAVLRNFFASLYAANEATHDAVGLIEDGAFTPGTPALP